MNKLLKSYFYWTYPRGHVHYDVLVTLILLFIFVTPHLWNYGDTPSRQPAPSHPMQVIGDGGRGIIVTVSADDLSVPASETDSEVRKQLRKAIEPVTGDAVSVTRWETAIDSQGNRVWKIWARR
ncbi:hypothetical protein P8935_10830 [Telmatobacter sp. DSM 110680]|uniref:Uncharacterized protein n=1 Tax=Telmatobacter sp. DSM 110680 TaxID=3036704 RepID=A0AAU7DRD8_9BACT